MTKQDLHFLLVCFSGQGHINPFLRLAKFLASEGFLVTFTATEFIGDLMQKDSDGSSLNYWDFDEKGRIKFEFFSDGLSVNDPKRFQISLDTFMEEQKRNGPAGLKEIIIRQENPVSCIITNPFLPWATDVADDLGIPSALLWVQSCAVFSIYYHFHHQTVEFPSESRASITVRLPGLPEMRSEELPSFLLYNDPNRCLASALLSQIACIRKLSWILVESFEELEKEPLESVSQILPLTPIGPLIKLAGEIKSSMFRNLANVDDCTGWLDTQSPLSVVYVAFGSIFVLGEEQMEEMAHGLRECGKPFLWVVKPPWQSRKQVLPVDLLEKVGENGKIVQWSPQEKVLSHPSIACFVTHCGWNSTLETLASGVPIIAFPGFGDQKTNAKFMVEVYKIGLYLNGEKGSSFNREDVKRCVLELTEGPKSEEIRNKCAKLKAAAATSVLPGESSHRNLRTFIDAVGRKAKSLPSAKSNGNVELIKGN